MGSAAIKRRLDRSIASISWSLAYPKASITHLGAIKSDDTPILLDTNPTDNFVHRPFRFEATWLRDENCFSVISKSWDIEASRKSNLQALKIEPTSNLKGIQKSVSMLSLPMILARLGPSPMLLRTSEI
nr:hypothetical protein CFP56_71298 [Quercus suber]